MNDTYTVFRKELKDLLGDRRSPRGSLIQGLIVVLLCGVGAPAFYRGEWNALVVTFMYIVFPAAVAGVAAADAFAGERERKTLETLLASPLEHHSIFIGKAATAVAFAMLVAVACLAAGTLTFLAYGRPLALFFNHHVVLGALFGALGSSALAASFAIIVSTRVVVARSAQQIASMGSSLIGMAAVMAVDQLGLPFTWGTLYLVDLVLFALAWVAFVWSMKAFRRHLVLERR